MKKEYDQMEWDFLETTMHKMGFCDTWVSWIMKCISTISTSVKVNGEPMPFCHPTHGIK